MKIRNLIAATAALLTIAGISAQAAETTKLFARSGSKMRIEGTSNIHDWRAQSQLIGGSLEVGPNFPLEPGQAVTPGKIEAQGEVFVTSRSLKSLKEDGTPYSDAMDKIMHEHLKAQENPRITFKLKELTLKEAPASKDAPYKVEAKGELNVGGVGKEVTFPAEVQPQADQKVKIAGTFPVHMLNDFKIEPPAPKVAFGLIKTAPEVKVIFEWAVAPRATK